MTGRVILLVALALAGGFSSGAGLVRADEFASEAVADSLILQQEQMFRLQLERLIRNNQINEAIELLEEKEGSEGLDTANRRRLLRLYRDVGRYDEIESLLAKKLAASEEEPSLADLRALAEALFAQHRPEEGQAVLQRMLDQDPTDPSRIRIAANLLSQRGLPGEAIRILEEGRGRIEGPDEFAQYLGRLYAETGNRTRAAREFCRVIAENPMNSSLMRAQILEIFEGPSAPYMLAEAEKILEAYPDVSPLKLVVAELRAKLGENDRAYSLLEPMIADANMQNQLLQLAMVGVAESRLPRAKGPLLLPRLYFSVRLLKALIAEGKLPRGLQLRGFDSLSRAWIAIMDNSDFESLPRPKQQEILEEARVAVMEMGQRFPSNSITNAAMLRLAGLQVDTLHQPEQAITIYQRLGQNPNASTQELHIARVGLGRAFIAAGDTVQARALFTGMVEDPAFREGRGRAHYHLGLIDFMGGHFQTAQDRLSAVAMEAPTASYTNDALDLALILVEQTMSSFSTPGGLERYGKALYFKAVHQPDSLRAELLKLRDLAPSELVMRARLDLARLYHDNHEIDPAIRQLDSLLKIGPASRYAPAALDLKGNLHLEREELSLALESFDRILTDYDGYVFADKIRDKIRDLRPDSSDSGKKELP